MGLDMYLNKVYFVKGKLTVEDLKAALKASAPAGVSFEPLTEGQLNTVEQECIYWRKANAIHRWFVENVQENVDNCASYFVDITQLKTLRDLCSRVVEDHSLAESLLPTQQGFFFGCTAYDDYYFDDIEYTLEKLNKLIEWYEALPEDSLYPEFSYQSSW